MKVYCYNIEDCVKSDFIKEIPDKGILADQDAEKTRNTRERLRKLAGTHLSKEMISRESGLDYNEIEIRRTSSGKPYLPDADLYFNISHSGDLVCGVTDDRPVGIDIERIRPVRRAVLDYLCTEEEYQDFNPEDIKEAVIQDRKSLYRFFMLWTRKEAFIKCQGKTLKNMRKLKVDETHYEFYQGFYRDYVITVCRKLL